MTQSGARAAMASASSASNASREAHAFASRLQRNASGTRCNAMAPGRSENTPTTSPSSAPVAIASGSACRLLPRPEARTAMRFIGHAASGGRRYSKALTRAASGRAASADADPIDGSGVDHMADGAMGEAEAIEVGADRGDIARRDHQYEADATVERAPHFVLRDCAFALQPVEYRRQHDRRGLDVEAESIRDHADDVLGQAAAGDVGHRTDATLRAIVLAQEFEDRLDVQR